MTKSDRLGQNTPNFSVKNSRFILKKGVFCPHSPKNSHFQTLTVGKPVRLCPGFLSGANGSLPLQQLVISYYSLGKTVSVAVRFGN